MIAKKQEEKTATLSALHKTWPLINIGLTVLLFGLGFWYLAAGIGLAEIGAALRTAEIGFIIAGLLAVLVMNLFKAWRWRLLYVTQENRPSFATLFWAIMLGQYVNLVVPFLRLGEIARLYVVRRQANAGGARTLGTLVVEKVLDIIILALTLIAVLPFIALPEYISHPGWQLGIMATILLVGLYVLAYQTRHIIVFCEYLTRWLPLAWAQRIMTFIISGLQGVSALRDKRATLALVGLSLLVGFTAVLMPYLLFQAFNIPLGLANAALIHVVVMIALTPPSTPAKIGVFDGAAAFMLLWFGLQSQALIASYTLIYHLVALLPPILLGIVAASRTNWRWEYTAKVERD